MSEKNKNQEDDFYGELDTRSVKHSCCSWQTMIIFFVTLLIATSILTIYLFYQVKQINLSYQKIYPSASLKSGVLTKIQLDPETTPEFTLSFTSEELTSIVAQGFKTMSFEMKEVQVDVTHQEMVISGKMIKPLKSDLKIYGIPEIQDGKLVLKTQKITAGKLTLPKFISGEIEKSFNNLLDENFKILYKNYTLTSVDLSEGQMNLTGQIKK